MRTVHMLGAAVLAAGLIGCGGGGGDEAASTTTASTTEATTAPATTERPTTTAPPTTAEDPSQRVIEQLAPLYEAGDPAGTALFAPGTAAATYYEALVLLSASSGPGGTARVVDGTIETSEDVTLSNFQLDEGGLIVDADRNGVPLSKTVAASGQVYEGVDEGEGITGEVHSIRHFDGDLQIIVTTKNEGTVDGELNFRDYVTEGRQLTQVFGSPVRPGATVTTGAVFEDAPTAGGVAYGSLIAGSIGVLEVELQVPPLG